MTRTHVGTFWMPTRDMRAAGPFRNGVERAIASLARARAVRDAGVRVFADDARASETIRGAEWWIQDVARDEPPKTFHTDCDAVVMSSGDDTNATEIRHPAVASVLYVGQAGGPTAVFGQRKKNARLVPRYPSEVAVAHPTRNTLLLFEGDRYHAVMHPPKRFESDETAEKSQQSQQSTQRVTVLVNWWRERPRGPADLPDRFVTPPFAYDRSGTGETNPHINDRPLAASCRDRSALLPLPVVSVVPMTFREHLPSWRAQTVPGAFAERNRSAFFAAKYAVPDETTRDAHSSSSLPEWPFEDEDEDGRSPIS
jgi:hypothetical protein